MTLTQAMGWSALIAWEMLLIFGPAVVGAVKNARAKARRRRAKLEQRAVVEVAQDRKSHCLTRNAEVAGAVFVLSTCPCSQFRTARPAPSRKSVS